MKRSKDYGGFLLLSILAFCIFISMPFNAEKPNAGRHFQSDNSSIIPKVLANNDYVDACQTLRESVISGTDSTWYHNGEVIYPDIIQPDTLVVVDAAMLNDRIILNGMNNDIDIADILHRGCIPYAGFPEYIRKQLIMNK